MNLFEALGFGWDRTIMPGEVPTYSIERACFRFHRMLPEFVWDAGVLEGNPFTFPEVQTLLDGVTVGGHKMSDQEQILNLAESSRRLLAQVKSGQFRLDKATFSDLHGIVAKNEALEWGHFRGEGHETNYTPDVSLGEFGRYTPLPTVSGAPALNRIFEGGLAALNEGDLPPFEKGLAFFLFGALQQFFFDGNKRTSRLMMNGVLMSNGIDAISVPAAMAQSFNEKMVRFYLTKDATGMMRFLVDCHPDVGTRPTHDGGTVHRIPSTFTSQP
ncbi:MAG: Fic family protein [Ferrimicrobium sp.]